MGFAHVKLGNDRRPFSAAAPLGLPRPRSHGARDIL